MFDNVLGMTSHTLAAFSRCIVNRKAGLSSDDAYTLAAFHDIWSIRPSIGVMAVRYTLAAFHDIWSMFRAYHKDHQAIILHLSLEKLALEGAF